MRDDARDDPVESVPEEAEPEDGPRAGPTLPSIGRPFFRGNVAASYLVWGLLLGALLAAVVWALV